MRDDAVEEEDAVTEAERASIAAVKEIVRRRDAGTVTVDEALRLIGEIVAIAELPRVPDPHRSEVPDP